MTESTVSPTLVVDEKQHYSCEQCPAKCCRFPWGITVTAQEYARYQQTPWIVERLKQKDVSFPNLDGNYRLPRVPLPSGGTGCAFLDEDNLCSMHKQEGHAFIPVTCQVYPFAFYETRPAENEATQVYTATSYFCKSIMENYGGALAESIEKRYEGHREGGLVKFLPESVSLGLLTVPQPTYLAMSDWLLSLINQPELPLPTAFMQVRFLLGELLVAYPGEGQLTIEQLNAAIQKLPPVSELELSPPDYHNLTGRVMVATRILLSIQEYSDLEAASAFKRFIDRKLLLIRIIEESGKIHLWDLPEPIDMLKARDVKLNLDATLQAELRRFFIHLVESRQIFTSTTNLLKILFIMSGNYPAILRLSRYVAFANGRSEVTFPDLQAAVSYVDLTYSHQAQTGDIIFTAREVIMDLLATGEGALERTLFCESY